jgi:O-antigen ligase
MSTVTIRLTLNRLGSSTALLLSVLLLGVGMGLVSARLIVLGQWQFSVALIAAIPGLILLHKRPFLALIIWLVLTPFLLHTDTAVERRVYWLVHRALPPLTVGIIVLSAALRVQTRKLPQLGGAELAMLGYVALSMLSIYLHNNDPIATLYLFYDRVIVPMCLYLIVRLSNPSIKELRWLLPVAFFIAFSQSLIGILSWFTPQFLPSDWLDKAGSRTVGSLVNYTVYTTSLTFAGLLVLHAAQNMKPDLVRKLYTGAFLLAAYSIFISFSRASWLAGLSALSGVLYLYPKFVLRVSLTVLPLILLLGSVLLAGQLEWARQRLYSAEAERSAVSRLAVYYAGYRLFQEKPLLGWGYGNYDLYDRQYQWRVPGFPANRKDQASHNLYLTLLAEQGIIGLLFYLGPFIWWLVVAWKRMSQLPANGFYSRKLLIVLWLVIFSHVIVNNFSNMKIVFGLGIWWITLSLIGRLLTDVQPATARVELFDQRALPVIQQVSQTFL